MAINAKDFLIALEEIESQKGISKETVITALKEALAKGYKKQLGGDDIEVRVEINAELGTIEMCSVKKVVKEVEDDFLEISVEEANAADSSKKYADGDEFIIPADVDDLRKGIAMSVKSILKQKFSEAEKSLLYEQFKDKIGTMITGKVEKVDDRNGVSVNIGRASVYLPANQLIGRETFKSGDQIKLYVQDVASGSKGAHIVVTRSGEGFLRCVFMEEIHEVYDGTIVIKGIAREAGERSKVAVYSQDPNVDPAGACIGPNGTRIQKVVGQLGNGSSAEKIDIIAYSENSGLYVMEALKPAHVVGVDADDATKTATVVVKDDSFSMAIGKKGVNVRLAAKLTGFSIDVVTETEAIEDGLEYRSLEELQAQDLEARNKAAFAALSAKVSATEGATVIPGLPEGYVAPMDRTYEEEDDSEVVEALQEESEAEEVAPAPVAEEKVEVIEEKPVEAKKEVKTTTSIEELEKNLASESQRNKKTDYKKSSRKAKTEEEDGADDKPSTITKISENATKMSIYTEEELRAMEEEDEEDSYDFDDEEEVDYDEYDDYYDDNK